MMGLNYDLGGLYTDERGPKNEVGAELPSL